MDLLGLSVCPPPDWGMECESLVWHCPVLPGVITASNGGKVTITGQNSSTFEKMKGKKGLAKSHGGH